MATSRVWGRAPRRLTRRVRRPRAATAMMTTDTHPKVAAAEAGAARVVGIAKGVGMIEPDMATMLAVVSTDAAVDAPVLDAMFRKAVDRTFNALSIDTDTSTSDMAVILASGSAGPVDEVALEAAVREVCLDLTRQLAADGEGAETLIVVTVDEAPRRRAGKAGGQGDREFAAGQDRCSRLRSELGAGGDGDRQVQRFRHRTRSGGDPFRRHRSVPDPGHTGAAGGVGTVPCRPGSTDSRQPGNHPGRSRLGSRRQLHRVRL